MPIKFEESLKSSEEDIATAFPKHFYCQNHTEY